MPYVFFVTICVIWGSSFTLMKKAALAFSPVTVGAGRVIGGAIILGALWWWRGTRDPLRKRDFVPLLFVILVGYAWPYCIQPQLVATHGGAFVGMMVGLVPLFTILVSIPLMGTYPTSRQLWGVLGAFACLGALLFEGRDRDVPISDICLAASVPLNYAMANACIRRHLHHISSLSLSFYILTATGLILAPIAIALPAPPAKGTADMITGTLSLAFLGVAGTGVATLMFNKLIRDQGPLFAGMSTNLIPLGALTFGWIDHERVTGLQLGALCGLLGMVAFVQYGAADRSDRGLERPPEPLAPRASDSG